jgi:hypothetical protein
MLSFKNDLPQSGHLMEYRAGIFCGEVEVVLSNSNYGIEFLKLFEHDGIHEIRFANIYT